MDVLVLGNGFDLAHKLPTTYLCFLKTTEYIVNLSKYDDLTIGKVFKSLQKDCNAIGISYSAYSSIYDAIELDPQRLKELSKKCKDNMWWNYFKNKYDKDVGWIDFEKEIDSVLLKINHFIKNHSPNMGFDIRKENADIVQSFSFFVEPGGLNNGEISNKHYYKSDYIIIRKNRKDNEIDRRKIAVELYQYLIEFSELLALYFEIFVDETLGKLRNVQLLNIVDAYKKYDDIITYNYTSLLEKLYWKIPAHIHGKLGSSIVLGINSNGEDEGNIDLSFVDFKKYYQRVVYETDLEYLRILTHMKALSQRGNTVTLSIIGHSLDVSDKDSIGELFDAADRIIVYYHNKEKLPEYVQNLISFFGKTRFDELRFDKNLRFLHLEELTGPPPVATVIKMNGVSN